MGKNDFLTPKAIGNRIKSKGLQKLRWYCQMCQKQCRDENGFKCHLTSESHKRQMMIFGEDPQRIVDGYSEEFESSFLEDLERAHPHSRVSAKVVYNEFIANKHHVHMNSTKWLTLTEFVQYLGKSGKCVVDETPKGWYLTLVKRDAAGEVEKDKRRKRDRAEKDEEERRQREIQAQIERAQQAGAAEDAAAAPQASELHRDTDGQPLVIALPAARLAGKQAPGQPALSRLNPAFAEDDRAGKEVRTSQPHKRSKVEELMERDKLLARQKADRAAAAATEQASRDGGTERRVPWLEPGIVVKVLSEELKPHGYYKKKGVVERMSTKYVGVIKMLESGDILQVDQAQLETVIPQPGNKVLIVRGAHKGSRATLLGLDVPKFQAQVRITRGPAEGTECWLEYEDICKYSPNGQ